MGNRLPTPEVRLQPGVAAADNANTSFFGVDDVGDLDTKPNFSGTSAAAPHAAAIAALVLERNGGPGSVTPAQMTQLLHQSAFPHDLDPNFASRKVPSERRRIGSDYDQHRPRTESELGREQSEYVHRESTRVRARSRPWSSILRARTLTAGNTTGGNNGLDLANTYFSNVYPGLVWRADHQGIYDG